VTNSVFNGFAGLIGMDFMSKYLIKIDMRKHVIVFEDLSPKPNMRGGHDEEWWRSTFYQFASMRSHWKELRDSLHSLKEDTIKIKGLRRLADRQNEEADKLMANSIVMLSITSFPWNGESIDCRFSLKIDPPRATNHLPLICLPSPPIPNTDSDPLWTPLEHYQVNESS
jgi:hypothetical protein